MVFQLRSRKICAEMLHGGCKGSQNAPIFSKRTSLSQNMATKLESYQLFGIDIFFHFRYDLQPSLQDLLHEKGPS